MLATNVCNNCKWFVEEAEIGDYDHEYAVKMGKGFCLIQDLYTMVEPDDPACVDFVEETNSRNA